MIGTLLRGIILLGLSGLVAYFLAKLFSTSDTVQITMEDVELNFSVLTGVVALATTFFLIWMTFYCLAFLLALIRFLLGDETAVKRYFDRSRQSKGHKELSNALVAFHEGNKMGALFHAKRAQKFLNNSKLSLLINTQIAHKSNDSKLVLSNYKKLLGEKDTRLVALSGIISEKIKLGDINEALDLAKKAFELHPKNLNIVTTLFNLQIQENDWVGARRTLQAKRKLEKMSLELFTKQEAILLYAAAREKRSKGLTKEALSDALAAVRQYPDFVPAIVFLTELEILSGNKKRIAKLLTKAWLIFPHPDIAKAFASLVIDESPFEKLKRFKDFIDVKKLDPQISILRAELYMGIEDFSSAKKAIEREVSNDPDNRILTLMALIERGLGAEDEVVRGWLTKAVYAPKAPDWICEHCSCQAPWEPVCSKCESFAKIKWKRPPFYKEIVNNSELLPLITAATTNIKEAQAKDISSNNEKDDNLIERNDTKNMTDDTKAVKKAREII